MGSGKAAPTIAELRRVLVYLCPVDSASPACAKNEPNAFCDAGVMTSNGASIFPDRSQMQQQQDVIVRKMGSASRGSPSEQTGSARIA